MRPREDACHLGDLLAMDGFLQAALHAVTWSPGLLVRGILEMARALFPWPWYYDLHEVEALQPELLMATW